MVANIRGRKAPKFDSTTGTAFTHAVKEGVLLFMVHESAGSASSAGRQLVGPAALRQAYEAMAADKVADKPVTLAELRALQCFSWVLADNEQESILD